MKNLCWGGRFDGIEPTGQAGEYQVRLGKSNDNLKFL